MIRSPMAELSPSIKLDESPEGTTSKLASLCQVRFNTWAGDENVSIRRRVCANGNAAVRQALGDLDLCAPPPGNQAVVSFHVPEPTGIFLSRAVLTKLLIRARADGMVG